MGTPVIFIRDRFPRRWCCPRPGPALLSALFAAAALPVSISTRAQPVGADQQLWTELNVVVPLSSNFSITAIGQLRLSDELHNPAHTAAGADLNYRTGEWTLSLGYIHQITGNREENPNITELARLTASYAHRFGRSTLLVRARVQNTLTASSNPWQLRLRAEYRWATANLGPISYLYANNEVFCQFSNDELFRNRFQAGVNLRFTRQFNTRVYYQYQNTKNPPPTAPKVIDSLGIVATYSF